MKQKLLGDGHIYKSEGAGRTSDRNCQGEDPAQLGVQEDGDRNSASTSQERAEEAFKALLEPLTSAAPNSDAAALSTCSCLYSRYVYLGILYPSNRPHAERACMLSNSKGGNSCALKLLILGNVSSSPGVNACQTGSWLSTVSGLAGSNVFNISWPFSPLNKAATKRQLAC